MLRRRFCLDASAFGRFLFPGLPGAEQAGCLLEVHQEGRADLMVPDLFFSEVGNVLSTAVRTGRMRADRAMEALDALRELDLIVIPTAELLAEAFSLAQV